MWSLQIHKSQAAVPERNEFASNTAQHLQSESYLHMADFCWIPYATRVAPRSAQVCVWVGVNLQNKSIELFQNSQPANAMDTCTTSQLQHQCIIRHVETVLPQFSLKGPALCSDDHFSLAGSFLLDLNCIVIVSSFIDHCHLC